jgi:uncharacterized protein YraI
MIRARFLAVATAFGVAMSAAAWAQQAYTTQTANVRAGPAPDFPVVVRVSGGTPVFIEGCLDGYQWCDVQVAGTRGWLNTRALQAYYGSRIVPLYDYGATIGFPIISFTLGNYWDSWYRGRPFYRERPRWEQRWSSYSYNRPNYDGRNYGRNYSNDRRYDNRYDNRPNVVQQQPQLHYAQPSQRGDYLRDRPQFQPQAQPQQRFVPQTTPQGGRIEQRGDRLIERQPGGRVIDRTPNDTEHQGQ